MRLRNVTGSREVIAESRFVVPEETLKDMPGKWHDLFGNQNPIFVEIGMGKGKFIHTMAKAHPEVNFIGIEKYSTVLLRAVQKMEMEELPNLKFLRMDAEVVYSFAKKTIKTPVNLIFMLVSFFCVGVLKLPSYIIILAAIAVACCVVFVRARQLKNHPEKEGEEK